MKTPDQFPLRFHGILGMGHGEWLMATSRSREECEKLARQFREFLASFGEAGSHPLKAICKNYSIKTRVKAIGEVFYLYIIIRPPFDIPDPQPPKNTPGPE